MFINETQQTLLSFDDFTRVKYHFMPSKKGCYMLDYYIFEKVKNPVLKWLGLYLCYIIFCLVFALVIYNV